MKKSIIAGAAIVAALGLAACTEEAKAAEATVYGAIDQRVEIVNGVADVNGDASDSYLGVNVSESLGENSSAFANIGMTYDSEATNALTTRDAYVGLTMSGVTVKAGRMETPTRVVVDGVVDAFEGNSFGNAQGEDRADSVVYLGADVSGVSLGFASVVDNGGEDKIDSYQAHAGVEIAGVSLGGVYTKNNTTKADTKAVVASVDVAGFGLGGAYEIAANDEVTKTVVASTAFGANTLRGGVSIADNSDKTYIAEVEHAFSKSTKAYANYMTDDVDSTEDSIMVGLKMTF